MFLRLQAAVKPLKSIKKSNSSEDSPLNDRALLEPDLGIACNPFDSADMLGVRFMIDGISDVGMRRSYKGAGSRVRCGDARDVGAVAGVGGSVMRR